MKLPPEFKSAIQFYLYMNEHIKELDFNKELDHLKLHFNFKDLNPDSSLRVCKFICTLGELRSACWQEVADFKITPETIYILESAMYERYPVTSGLKNWEKIKIHLNKFIK